MYSMAVLNPDNLPDLGQGNQFTKSPPNEREKGGKVWTTAMGAGETWSMDGGKGVCVVRAVWHKWKDLTAWV